MSCIKRIFILCIGMLSCTAFAAAVAADSSTTVFRGGRIITMDGAGSIAEAMAIRNGRVVAVGTAAVVTRDAGQGANVVDLRGKTVMPGIIDTHTHAISWARGIVRDQIDATKMTSIDELVAELRRRAEKTPPGTWITGAGWDDAKLKEKRYVRRSDIDAVTPRHPVFLVHVSGHLSVANSEALRIAGVTRDTPPPDGGVIEKDASGELTGILKETADNLVSSRIPPDPPDMAERAARLATERAAAVGITTYHDIAIRPADMRGYQKAHTAGELRARVHLVPLVSSVADAEKLVSAGVATGFGDDWLKLGGVKLFTDGGMGARTIAIHAPPVQGEPENFGVLLWADADLRKAHRLLAQNGWQLITHAIGDRAIEQVLDSYAAAAAELKLQDRRWRIAHSGITPPAIQRRYREGAVIADGNPAFVHWIGSWFTKYGPERVRWSYPGKSYFENGVVLTAGTDVPVTPVSPWWGVWAAVARKEKLSGNVLAPEERLTIQQTLKVYTNNGAYAGFDERERGSIERDKFADFIVLDRDPLSIPTDELKDVRVLETYVGGRRVYAAPTQ